MEPGYCIDCGATIRIKSKTPGTCPYCGVDIATGREGFQATEPLPEPEPIRKLRRRDARIHGMVQISVGVALLAVLVSMRWYIPTFVAAMLVANGLYRFLFSSGPGRDDEDYEAKD